MVVATNDDFGVLADDGFENGSTDAPRGGEIVDVPGVAAIGGKHVLHAASGQPAALRLQQTATEPEPGFGCASVESPWYRQVRAPWGPRPERASRTTSTKTRRATKGRCYGGCRLTVAHPSAGAWNCTILPPALSVVWPPGVAIRLV